MNTQTSKLIPLLARGFAPGAAVATGLLSPMALGASGDLDPAFADLGRLGPILTGPAWSLEALDDGSVIVGGGDMQGVCDFYYCWYHEDYDGFESSNFVNQVSDAGAIDPAFNATVLEDTQVLDIVRQASGEIVAVGRKTTPTSMQTQLTAFRLHADGSLDTAFGIEGVFALSNDKYGIQHVGTSVVLDPDGRIVIAGTRDKHLIALRLLPDGTLDDSFGISGMFSGPELVDDLSASPKVQRTEGGGYRLAAPSTPTTTLTNTGGCRIVALTSNGSLDNAFGTAGVATVKLPSGAALTCKATALQPDGRLLIAGNAWTHNAGYVLRLLSDGQPDPGFSAPSVVEPDNYATALGLGEDGSIVVARTEMTGASITRLQADGQVDTLFGNAGSTMIDLPSDTGAFPVVYDMLVRPDGSVVAAGKYGASNQAFVVRLLGAGRGNSAGVLGAAEQGLIETDETSGEVVVNVRRSGGSFGSVSVAYQAASGDPAYAVGGEDFDAVEGRLTWEDGDMAEQEIRVPILVDDDMEEYESFSVVLSDVQGGAGLGTRSATVQILPDGSPYGQFEVQADSAAVSEGQSAAIYVYRNYYSTGGISVTLAPISGTATARSDFDANPVTVAWTDGEYGEKTVMFGIRRDNVDEPAETFTVELSNPTGGAMAGPRSSTSVTIAPSSYRQPSGGGALGHLSLLLLGVLKFLFSVRKGCRPR